MIFKNCTPAFVRYQVRVLAASLAYAILLIAAVWQFKHHPPTGALRYLVAVSPAIPLVGIIAVVGLYLKEETDEFQRALMVRQMLWSTGLTLSLATIWGFLEDFGVAPHLEAYWAAAVWLMVMGFSRFFIWRRYQ
jgi:hypothetical protein